MQLSDLDYNLPQSSIATKPQALRGESKLLVIDRASGQLQIDVYKNWPKYTQSGDVAVLNETKVGKWRVKLNIPELKKTLEILFLKSIDSKTWEVIVGGGNMAGQKITFGEHVIFFEKSSDGLFFAKFVQGDAKDLLAQFGQTPIPPYMKRESTAEDDERYNTVFGRAEGSAASPTASLNITNDQLKEFGQAGGKIAKVILDVGWGTFAPVKTERIEDHHIHSEDFVLSPDAANVINRAKSERKKVLAVGTTVCRVLETCSNNLGKVAGQSGSTNIFIYPGYKWKCVDMLLTNFHAPKSSLIALVYSFAGVELTQKAYKYALENDFRFLSYGDSMLVI